jgi:hypothetical protein
MILSINHVRSIVEAPAEIREEIEKFKEAYILMCHKEGKAVCAFERNYKTSHLQLQLVPIPTEKAKTLRATLLAAGDQNGIEFCFVSSWKVCNLYH